MAEKVSSITSIMFLLLSLRFLIWCLKLRALLKGDSEQFGIIHSSDFDAIDIDWEIGLNLVGQPPS